MSKDFSTDQHGLIKSLYNGFLHAGFNPEAARAMLGEIGRENGFNPKYIFGSHTDDANQKTNIGMISWQGSRKDALESYLASKGLIQNGQMVQSQDTINAQAEFLFSEMNRDNPEIVQYLNSPGMDAHQAMDMVGRDFIRWAIDNPKYRESGLKNRNNFYDLASRVVGGLPYVPNHIEHLYDDEIKKTKDNIEVLKTISNNLYTNLTESEQNMRNMLSFSQDNDIKLDTGIQGYIPSVKNLSNYDPFNATKEKSDLINNLSQSEGKNLISHKKLNSGFFDSTTTAIGIQEQKFVNSLNDRNSVIHQVKKAVGFLSDKTGVSEALDWSKRASDYVNQRFLSEQVRKEVESHIKNVEEIVSPKFVDEPGFNPNAYASKRNNAKYFDQNTVDDLTYSRLMNSRSPTEFDYWLNTSNVIPKDYNEASRYWGGVEGFSYNAIGLIGNPSTYVAGPVGAGAKALSIAKGAGKFLAGTTDAIGQAVAYAAADASQQKEVTLEGVAFDAGLPIIALTALRIPKTASLAKSRLNSLYNEGSALNHETNKLGIAVNTEANNFIKENPNATPQQLEAHLDEKFKDNSLYTAQKNAKIIEGQTLEISHEKLTGEHLEQYQKGIEIKEKNNNAIKNNEKIDAQENLNEVKERNSKAQKAHDENVKSGIKDDVEELWSEMTPEQQRMITVTEGNGVKSFRIMSQNFSQGLRTRFNKAISSLAGSTKEMTDKTIDFVNRYQVPDTIVGGKIVSLKNKQFYRTVTDASGKKYKLTYNDDFLEAVNIKGNTVNGMKVRQSLIEANPEMEEGLIDAIRNDMKAKEKAFFSDEKNIENAKSGKKTRSGFDIVNGENIYTRQDAHKVIKDYYNNKSSKLFKQTLEEIDKEIFGGPTIRKDIDLDAPEAVVELRKPKEAEVSNKVKMPVREKVLSEDEVYKQAGIDDKYRTEEFDIALKKTIRDKIVDKVLNDIESNISVQKAKALSEKLRSFAGKMGLAKASLDKGDGFLGRLLAPSVINQSSKSKLVRFASYKIMENPIGSMIETSTVSMGKLNDMAVIKRGFSREAMVAEKAYMKATGTGPLEHFFNEAEFKIKFNKDLFEYRSLPKADKVNHPHHAIFNNLNNALTEIAKKDALLKIENKLPGWELVQHMADEDFDSYIPQKMDTEKFKSLSVNQRKAYFEDMVGQYMSVSGLTKEQAGQLVRALESSYMKRDFYDNGVMLGEPGSMYTNNLVSEVLNKLDIPLSKKNAILEDIKNSNDLAKLRRSKIDYNREIYVEGGESFKLSDLLNHDVNGSMIQHVDTTVGSTHLKQKLGIHRDIDFEDLISDAIEEGATPAEIENLRAMYAQMKGLPYGDKPNRGFLGISRILRALMLQMAGFTQFIEYASIANSMGVFPALKILANSRKSIKIAKQLANGERVDNEIISGLSQVGYIPGENIYGEALFNYDVVRNGTAFNAGEVSSISTGASGFYRATGRIEDITASLSMQKSVLASQQVGLVENLAKTAVHKVLHGDTSGNVVKDFIQAGLDFSSVRRLIDNGVLIVKDGELIKIDAMKAINASDIHDLKHFQSRIVKLSAALIQETLPGETGRWVNSNIFKAMMMMRSFSITSIFKQTARVGFTHGTSGFLAQTLGTAMWGSAVLWARSRLKALAMPEDKRDAYIEKYANYRQAVLSGFMYSSTLSIGQDILNFSTALVAPEFSQFSTGKNALGSVLPWLGKMGDVIDTGQEITSAPYKTVTGNADEINYNKIVRNTPFMNTVPGVALRSAYYNWNNIFNEQ